MLPVRYPMERNRVKYLKLFDREKIMYATMNRLESEIKQNWRPNFYFANDSLLVMEDIKKMNFQCLSSSQISPELTKACLEQLAQLHAKGIAENISKGISNLQKDSPLNDCLLERYNPWVQTGFMAIQALALKDARNQSDQRQKFIKDELILSMNNIFDLLKATNDTLKILCHCDLRPKNIFFKKVEDGQDSDSKIQCRFVDFQEVRCLPPAIDVLLFLYYNLREPILTDDIFTEYTKYYYAKLKSCCENMNIDLGNHLTDADFEETLDRYKGLALVMRALHAPFLCDPSYTFQLRNKDIEKYIECMSADRLEMIAAVCEKDKTSELFISESIQAIVEFFDREQ
ncbi:uncharacterized protein LOC119646338 isoform X2 [Hermetia illucens]|nr:uncharacterized protein LOC119646338 isoform X2 [Hermetia illucens]